MLQPLLVVPLLVPLVLLVTWLVMRWQLLLVLQPLLVVPQLVPLVRQTLLCRAWVVYCKPRLAVVRWQVPLVL